MSGAPRDPLSWLTLERYALGELDARERERVEAQLAVSPEDRASLESILADVSELPALPAILPKSWQKRAVRWLVVASGALAAAAALALAFLGSELPPARRVLRDGTKGGDVALALVGEKHGTNATHFAQGERFKLQVTCPPAFAPMLRVLVFQAGARYEPLPSALPYCGNLVAWPGAFALDGAAQVQVCVAWGPEAEHASSPQELGGHAVCALLVPE